MGSKGGGGIDTSSLRKAADQANKILQENYQQTRQDVQPWYNMGASSVSRLSDLLGLSGGSIRSRDQIYKELLPQYTSQQAGSSAPSGSTYITPSGQLIDFGGDVTKFQGNASLSGVHPDELSIARQAYLRGDTDRLEKQGFRALAPTAPTKEVIDYAGLNAAVDASLAGQERPSDFGSLMSTFGIDKFQEDPSYKFRQAEEQKALQRAMSAQGVTLGGGGYGTVNPQVARALQEQSQNLASQEYQNSYSRYVNDQMNKYNMLMGTAGMGQGAYGTMAQAGQAQATGSAGLATDLASAQMNAQIARASRPSMFQTLLGAGAQLGSAWLGGR